MTDKRKNEISYCAGCEIETKQTYMSSAKYKGFNYDVWDCNICRKVVIRETPESQLVTERLKLGEKPLFKPHPELPKFVGAAGREVYAS
jgi:hypothetical protein